MSGSVRRIANVVVFPFLAALYPIIALYAVNLREMVPLQSMVMPGLIALAGTCLVMILLRVTFGDWQRAGALTLLLLTLFFTYGIVWDALPADLPGGQVTLLAAWIGLVLVGVPAIRAIGTERIRRATPILNGILAVLLLGNGAAIVRFQLSVVGDGEVRTLHAGEAAGGALADVRQPPDIYWIILDRYGSEDVVREYYDHDVSSFVDELRQRGFYVAEDATANYLKTTANIMAARNMDYLDGQELLDRAATPDDWGPLYREMVGPFRVLDVLRPLGYRFIYSGSHWQYTASHDEADVNYVFDADQDEFAGVLGETSLLEAAKLLGPAAPLDGRRTRFLRTHFQWGSLHDSIRLGSPKFVHAHLGLPHPPYVFEPDGRYVPSDLEGQRTRPANYANNVEFANASVLDFVDALLGADPGNPPVIIVQSEEGPWPERFEEEGSEFSWIEEATDEELHEKFGIMSAFFLPGLPGDQAEEAGLYSSISLVNEFRVILNHYVGTEYELLPDRNFVWPAEGEIYEFVDVTERVRRVVEVTEDDAARAPR